MFFQSCLINPLVLHLEDKEDYITVMPSVLLSHQACQGARTNSKIQYAKLLYKGGYRIKEVSNQSSLTLMFHEHNVNKLELGNGDYEHNCMKLLAVSLQQ